MRIETASTLKSGIPVAIPIYQGDHLVPATSIRLPGNLLEEAREDGFQGKPGETYLLRPAGRRPARQVILVGLGPRPQADAHSARLLGAASVGRLGEARWPSVQILLPAGPAAAQAAAEGAVLASYRFDRHKSQPAGERALQAVILVGARGPAVKSARRGALFAEAVNFARDLINQPPSLKAPESLGRAAQNLAGESVSVRVFDKAALAKMGANALLGVNRGSAHPPVLVHLHYKPARTARRRLALVGKGVTFDSGGLSLKPADGMMTMKYDMAGAASVLAVFSVLARLAPDAEVHGVAPITENMPGPDAYKPGDVVRAMNGKTIEVLNTDAEGRVILADALSFAAKLPVDSIVDIATLTGAATVALGRAYAALMTNNAALETRLRESARAAGEKVWPLPLEASYKDHIRSKVADLKNIGNPGEAGTIIGGLFLQEFVDNKPWAHIDMASVGWSNAAHPFGPAGSTGAMIRTLLEYVDG